MNNVSHELLVATGVGLSNELHRFLTETPNPTKQWGNQLLVLALLAYAVSMAKFSDLDKPDFLQLCGSFYDNLTIDRIPES